MSLGEGTFFFSAAGVVAAAAVVAVAAAAAASSSSSNISISSPSGGWSAADEGPAARAGSPFRAGTGKAAAAAAGDEVERVEVEGRGADNTGWMMSGGISTVSRSSSARAPGTGFFFRLYCL